MRRDERRGHGALVFEGLAKDLDEAAELAVPGRSPSRRVTSTTAWDRWRCYLGLDVYAHRKKQNLRQHRYTNMSEQMAKILRMGANDQT